MSENKDARTYRELYQEGKKRLAAAGLAEADTDARLLLLYITGFRWNELLLRYEEVPADGAGAPEPVADRGREPGGKLPEQGKESLAARYLSEVDRRAARVPLQYITHEQDFCGLDLYVDERVLIPRQDTETLVELVLQERGKAAREHRKPVLSREKPVLSHGDLPRSCSIQGAEAAEARTQNRETDEVRTQNRETDEARTQNRETAEGDTLLDLCTGSGCIAIALAKLGRFSAVTAADISADALMVAEENLRRTGAEVRLIRSDLFSEIPERFDVITANPPYIRKKVIETLTPEVREHEPRLALDGDEDGLAFYRRLAAECPAHLNPGGSVYFEIGYDQGEAVCALLRERGFSGVRCVKDLAGLDRVVTGNWTGSGPGQDQAVTGILGQS